MLLATSLLQQFGLFRPLAAGSEQTAQILPDDPAHLKQDESAHRLANLLQIVLSNLERTADAATKLTISAARDQVSAVCRLQELLNGRGADLQPVSDHLRLVGEALEALLLRPAGHCLTIEVDPLAEGLCVPTQAFLGVSQLVAEAVMNAAKHAFPGGPGGSVTFRLSRVDTWLLCVIGDDGVGSRGKLGRVGSHGMTLAEALAHQAGGRCAWVFGQYGTEVRIAWPIMPIGADANS
jgi:two-component sensor histidine kinase